MARRTERFLGMLTSEAYRPNVQHEHLSKETKRFTAKQIVHAFENPTVSSRDRALRKRTVLMLINSVASIALMIITLETEWDPETMTMDKNGLSRILKFVIFALSIVFILQLIEYYRKWAKYEQTSGETARVERDDYIGLEPISDDSDAPLIAKEAEEEEEEASLLTVLQTTNLWWQFLIEVIIALIMPLPGLNSDVDKYFGLFMFARLYVVLRVAKHFSPMYRKRKFLKRIPGYSPASSPKFSVFMTTKLYFYQAPITFALTWLVTVLFTFAYCLWVFEREAPRLDPAYFEAYRPIDSYWTCVYIVTQNLFLGWAADSFFVYNPYTPQGRGITMLGVVLGVFLFALLIDFVHSRMQPTAFQAIALKWVMYANITEREKEAAARIIQVVWRHHKWKKSVLKSDINFRKMRKAKIEEYAIKYTSVIDRYEKVMRQKGKFLITHPEFDQKEEKQNIKMALSVDKSVKDLNQVLMTEMREMKALIMKQQETIDLLARSIGKKE